MARKPTINASAKHAAIVAMSATVDIAAADAGEGAKGPRKFDVLAYTGGELVVANYDLPVVVDLSGLSHAKSLVANLDHADSKRVGNVTASVNDGKELRLSGTASAATAHRDEVINSADAGFQWQASIEAHPKRLVTVAEGKKVAVNGREFTGPIYVARAATLKGFAFVSHGADDDTTVKIAATAAHKQERDMDPELKAFIESIGLVAEDLNDDQIAGIKANFAGKKAPAKKAAKYEDVFAAAKAENDRQEAIADIAGTALAENPENFEVIDALCKKAIDAKWNVERLELELLRASRPQGRAPAMHVRNNDKPSQKVIEAALCMQGQLPNVEKKFDDQTLQAAHDKFRDGIGLRQLFIMGARENGYRGDTFDVNLDVQRYAFNLANNGRQLNASGFSTLSVPGILSNTANKFLQEGWSGQDMAWRQISRVKSVRDFKTVTSYKMSGSFKYVKVGPGGEITHGTVSEDTYTNKADTYGRMFSVSRTDLINDDLGALTQVPMELGMGASDAFNEVFWTEFLDNSTFFASGNSNVNTGVADMTTGGLNATEVIFMAQTKPNGVPLGLMPAIILVPPTIRNAALTLMGSALLIDGTATAVQGSSNVYQGRYRVVSSPYMENTALTGYSTAAWYMLADPARLATIESVFLNGREAPTVETATADFNVLGAQMRAYHDFGVNQQEYRAGVRADGGSS